MDSELIYGRVDWLGNPTRRETDLEKHIEMSYGRDDQIQFAEQTVAHGLMCVWHGKLRGVFTPISGDDKRHQSALTPACRNSCQNSSL